MVLEEFECVAAVQSQFIIVPMYRKGNKTDFNNY
jgi:hypothetical protein